MPFSCLRIVRVAAVFLSLLCVLAGNTVWAAERIELVSRALPGLVSETGGYSSNFPVLSLDNIRRTVSADGRYVVFLSLSTNLVASQVDTNAGTDVFLHDRVNGTTQLVSHTSAGAGVAGNGASSSISISADGRYVAFSSGATNLISGVLDTNTADDIFLFDRDTGALTLISHTGTSNTTAALGLASYPMISADGSWVVFASRAQNILGNQNSSSSSEDVFLWARATNQNRMVSHASTSTVTDSNGTSIVAVVNPDGSRVAFISTSTNLVTGATDTNGKTDIFLWDRAADTNQIVSRASTSATVTGNGASAQARLSTDGEQVLFLSDGTNYVTGQTDTNAGNDAFLFNRATGAVTLVSRSAASASATGSGIVSEADVSGDGSWAAFASPGNNYVSGQTDSNIAADVFLWSRASGTVDLVSRQAGTTTTASASPGSTTSSVAISADGSFVAYASRGTALVTGQSDTFGFADLFVFSRSTGTNTLFSGAGGSATTAADDASRTPVFSADGQWLAFVTRAPNIVPGAVDTNYADDVLIANRTTGATTLVSRRHAASPSATGGGPSTLYFIPGFGFIPTFSLSANGRYVAFLSDADRLVPGQVDVNLGSDVFFYDRQAGTITLVSRANGTTATAGSGISQAPAISADGRWVTFYSQATNLAAGVVDTNNVDDIFLWDSTTGAMTLVSHVAGSLTTAAAGLSPVISSDGSWVVFTSTALNLVAGQSDSGSSADVFLWERATGTITLVSHRSTGSAVAAGGTNDTWMSANGSFVAFMSTANNIIAGQSDSTSTADLFLWNRATGAVTLVSYGSASTTTAVSASAAHMSADGNWIAFNTTSNAVVAGLTDTNAQNDLFLFERATGIRRLVSRSATSATTAGNQASQGVMLNSDGSRLVFLSRASNLISGGTDSNSANDVFVFLRSTDEIFLASHALVSDLTAGNAAAVKVGISGDGSKAVFLSAATNLVSGQTDVAGTNDLFLYDINTGSLSLLSHRATSATAGLATSSEIGALSNDGSVIGFSSPDAEVVANDYNARYDVFLWINETGTDLSITKTDGLSSAVPGQTVTYLITARNLGQVSVTGATVTDSFPAAFQGASWTCVAAGGASCAASGTGSISQSVNLPANGTVTFTVIGTVAADATGSLVNTASIALPVGITDLNPANNAATDSDTLAPQANLTSAITDAPDPVGRGGLLTYTISVMNAGPSAAASVTVQHTLPIGVTFVQASGTGWSCGHAGGMVTCTRPSLGPGSAPSLSVQVTAPVQRGFGTLTSLVDVQSATPDPVATNGAITTTSVLQPGITVAPVSGLTTTEAGGTATFSVVLDTAPLADVTISLASSDTAEGTVSPAALTFTTSNWSTPRTVTVTGVDDDYDDGSVAFAITTGAAVSTDAGYAGIDPANVEATNQDDDTAGITVSAIGGPTTEAGGTATFTVVLTARPRADVTISLASSNTAEGTVDPAALTFTTSDWSTPRTVTVTGVDDDYDEGDVAFTITTGAASSTDPGYNGTDPADVPVTNQDDDAAGFTVSAISGPTTEAGGTATFTVVLTARPRADVTISLTSSDTAEGTVDPASLTFTTDTWSVPQTVTVTGVDDDYDDGDIAFTITTGAAVSTDSGYSGIDPADVAVTNQDDDTAGFTVSPASGPTTEAGGTATFTVVLTSRPRADVTISLASSNTTEGTIDPASLTFTTDSWNAPQTVTVTGVNDDYDDGDVAFAITTGAAVSTDTGYAGIDPADVAVTNQDDDTASFTVSPASGPTTEAGGTATFTVVLTARPRADVTVALASSDTGEGTVSPASLTFTTDTWSVPQTVTVTGVDDNYDDGDVAYTVALGAAVSTDAVWAGIDPADVAVTNQDDDTVGFTVTSSSGPTTEAGGTATFTVVLTARPRADVTIGLSSSDTGEGTVSPASLTFTTDTWSTPQTVTVTGVDDDYDDDDVAFTITTGTAVSTDAVWAGLDPADVEVTNQDDDTAGIEVSPTSGLVTTEEGGTATFTVSLTARPQEDVTITLESSDTGEGTVDPESLTFTADAWSAQTVTITGVDDDYIDGDVAYTITTGAAESTDAAWAGIDPADVEVTNEEDGDTAGIEVSPTSGLITTEGGGTATFTVTLAARPQADVTITLESSDPGEGQPTPATLTFTTDDWAPKTVTVTGQDDDLRDGDAAYTIVIHPAQSGDPAFAGIDPADVAAVNRDDSYEGVFYAITPCRLVDTRQPGFGPALANNQIAIVTVHGACGIPPTARAVALNLTFSGAGQRGTVLVYPGDLPRPPVPEYLWISAGNFSRSLSTLMKLGANGTLAILPKLQAPRLNPTVHIVLDVSGYFE